MCFKIMVYSIEMLVLSIERLSFSYYLFKLSAAATSSTKAFEKAKVELPTDH